MDISSKNTLKIVGVVALVAVLGLFGYASKRNDVSDQSGRVYEVAGYNSSPAGFKTVSDPDSCSGVGIEALPGYSLSKNGREVEIIDVNNKSIGYTTIKCTGMCKNDTTDQVSECNVMIAGGIASCSCPDGTSSYQKACAWEVVLDK